MDNKIKILNMSYNGIGLKSAKGSSTSGYIQRNISDAKAEKIGESKGKHFYARRLSEKRQEKIEKQKKFADLSIDKDIVDHETKREIEVKVMEYRDKMEAEHSDMEDEEIDELVEKYRIKLHRERQKRPRNRELLSYNRTVNPFTQKNEARNEKRTDKKPPTD